MMAEPAAKRCHLKVTATWFVLLVLTALWVAVFSQLFVGERDLEAYLRQRFRGRALPDAFEFVNDAAPVYFWLHTLVCVASFVAAFTNRHDVLCVLCIGPALSLVLIVLGQSWSDPSWFVILNVASIGSLVSLVVAFGHWFFKRPALPAISAQGDPTKSRK
jgi:hypothetical protein